MQAIHEMRRSKIVVVIAHRLSTVRGADYIPVLDKGHLVESGSWGSLLPLNNRIGDLWRLQSTDVAGEQPEEARLQALEHRGEIVAASEPT